MARDDASDVMGQDVGHGHSNEGHGHSHEGHGHSHDGLDLEYRAPVTSRSGSP